MTQTIWIMVCVIAAALSGSPVLAGFEQKVFRDDSGEHRYAVFLPQNYSSDREWPVILFLHGAGERGTDGQRQLSVGLGPVIRRQSASFPFVAVFPQCEDTNARYLTGWLADTPDAQRALNILHEVERDYSIDAKRRILTGWSMGGYGTWSIAARSPDYWAAVVPLAGGGETTWASELTKARVWAFHGSDDGAIRPQQSRMMIAAIQKAGGSPRYTEVSGGEHDIASAVYGNDAVQKWLRDPGEAAPTALTLTADSSTTPGAGEFLPAMELFGAVAVRLGNNMLEALAMSLPDMLPKGLVGGRLNDIYDSTVVEGRSFSITFGGISYSADLHRIRLKAYRPGRVNVQVGVENAQIYISGTSVLGRDHSASTGPIQVVIGHRYPVWLSFDVEPVIVDRQLKLKLAGSRFDIPGDNWYVTAPAGVSVSGFGMTREKVSDGLVSGLYGSRSRIEREVQAAVPALVREMEKRLSLNEADQLVNSFWPLPVYRPRVRLWPQDVAVDEHGISVVLGLTAAAMTPESAPKQPSVLEVSPLKASDLPASDDLQLSVAPGMLGHLTQLLVDADVAHINVLDIPERAFAPMADRTRLADVFPALRDVSPQTEISTDLYLRGPINVGNSQSDNLLFSVPQLEFVIHTRAQNDAEWTPFTTIRANVSQEAVTQLHRVTHETRSLQLIWSGDPVIVARTGLSNEEAAGETSPAVDTEQLQALLGESWKQWIGQGPASQTVIPDLNFGLTRLRLDYAGWKPPHLAVSFAPAGVRITNTSSEPLEYETRSPFSPWGGPYKLEPGKTHNYEVSFPLVFRRRVDGKEVMYTLDAGSYSEFRAPHGGGPPQLFKAREDLNLETSAERSGD